MDFSILILYFGTEREKMKRFCLPEKASNPLLMAHPQAVFWKRSEKNDIFYFYFSARPSQFRILQEEIFYENDERAGFSP
jgi:hypothetical protein